MILETDFEEIFNSILNNSSNAYILPENSIGIYWFVDDIDGEPKNYELMELLKKINSFHEISFVLGHEILQAYQEERTTITPEYSRPKKVIMKYYLKDDIKEILEKNNVLIKGNNLHI